MGVNQGNLQAKDVDVILENLPITIPLRYILTSSNYCKYVIAISISVWSCTARYGK